MNKTEVKRCPGCEETPREVHFPEHWVCENCTHDLEWIGVGVDVFRLDDVGRYGGIVTYQTPDRRVFEATLDNWRDPDPSRPGETGPETVDLASADLAWFKVTSDRLKWIAHKFVFEAEAQVPPSVFSIHTTDDFRISVDVSEWPEGEGFEEWFDHLMDRFGVKVFD
jgi:hypothetical protein